MKISIFGATGRTGLELVKQALEQGHAVTAFTRSPEKLGQFQNKISVVRGDILDAAQVDTAIKNQQAVLSALGSRTIRKNNILSTATRNILKSMQTNGVRRFVCESSLHVGDSKGQLGWFFSYVFIPLFLKHPFADKEIQESYIRQSNLDWGHRAARISHEWPEDLILQSWIQSG